MVLTTTSKETSSTLPHFEVDFSIAAGLKLETKQEETKEAGQEVIATEPEAKSAGSRRSQKSKVSQASKKRLLSQESKRSEVKSEKKRKL